MKIKNKLILGSIVATAVMLSACNDSSKKKQQEQEEEATQSILNIDASDYDNFVYYNLETLEKIDVVNPETSSDWHIGFRRSSIVLNGGDAGSGNVAGALAAENTDFYDGGGSPILSAFINATGDNQTAHFDAATAGSELTEYMEDENTLAIDGNSVAAYGPVDHWYEYNTTTHQISVNDSSFWVIRSSDGDSYAKFHVTDIAMNVSGFTMDDISFEFNYQSNVDSDFAVSGTAVANLDVSGGAVCYDIDAPGTASCTGAAWDLRFDPSLEIYLNSGIEGGGSGAAFGPVAASDISNPPVNNDGRNVPHWEFDGTSGIFTEESWYAYNLEDNHKLWSNFNVYAIDTDTTNPESVKVKAQIHSYYSDTGASGHLSVRVEQL